jgi:hypothetical protein
VQAPVAVAGEGWRGWVEGEHQFCLKVRTPVVFRMGELPIAESAASLRDPVEKAVRRLVEIPSRQQQPQRTLLDWLRVEYGIEKPSNKLLAVAELDSDTWV